MIPPVITFPARPINGGPFEQALPKAGDWTYEPKYNGWRGLVHIESGAMFNRHGARLSIEHEFKAALDIIRGTLDAEAFKWADCEALQRRHKIGMGTLIVLDVVPEPTPQALTPPLTPPYTYVERKEWIRDVLPCLFPDVVAQDDTVYRPPTIAAANAAELWTQLQHANSQLGCQFYEGFVAKRNDSRYPTQLISSSQQFHLWMKHRWPEPA